MKTSAPTICNTACSPLTARLSITMSLYGRRPKVVLSLVIWTSLMTTPSSDTTSLPMLLSFDFFVFWGSCLAPERPPRSGGRGGVPGRPGQDHRDIILSTRVVGCIDQRMPRGVQRVVHLQHLRDAAVVQHVRQAVGAQQVGV